ncbi:hypothetical protein V6N11_070210 [Hibiscus sabdariffa]|uniref:Uncharacterized protein n=1 Tax=Hibiscus sabdariffa TaxID=183260 RepID=A0ABR2QEU3_9ROSI
MQPVQGRYPSSISITAGIHSHEHRLRRGSNIGSAQSAGPKLSAPPISSPPGSTNTAAWTNQKMRGGGGGDQSNQMGFHRVLLEYFEVLFSLMVWELRQCVRKVNVYML